MGASSSKVGRRLPTKISPGWVGARTDPGLNQTPKASLLKPSASESKTEAIQQDAMDPQFAANLSRLGQVTVNNPITTPRTDPSMERLLRSRELSEQQASSSKSTHNRVRASQLAELLHEYRSNAVPGQLPVLAKKYGIDEDVLKRLVGLVNNPSYNPDSVERIVGKDGQERISMMAVWS